MIAMKPKDAFELIVVGLNKCKSYPEEKLLPEDGFYIYLHQHGKKHRDKKDELRTLSGEKKCIE